MCLASFSPGVAFDCAVDGGPRDAEQVAKLGRAVLSGSMQRYEMSFLARVELWLLSAQASFGFRDLHAFAGAEPDEIRLELRDHCQDVEQQPADRIGWVVHGSAETELHLSLGEILEDRAGIGK